MSVDELRTSDVMAHPLDALDAGSDIGHFGRLVFTIVARRAGIYAPLSGEVYAHIADYYEHKAGVTSKL